MVRGAGEVFDAYFDVPPAPARARSLLIPLEPSGRIVAAVALRLLGHLNACGLAATVVLPDVQARALCRAPEPSTPERGVTVLLATAPPTPRPDCVLAIVEAAPLGACAVARWLSLYPDLPFAVVGIGSNQARLAQGGLRFVWIGSIPERDAIRAALGAEPPSLRGTAGRVRSWLEGARLLSAPAELAASAEPPGAFSPAQKRT